MAREWIVAGWAAALVLAAGCSKSDPLQDRFAQQGSRAQRNKDLADIPLADPPKILPHTHFAAGRLFETQGSIGKAIEQYRKAVAVNHNFAEAYHRLGRMLNIANQHDEALSAFTRAVELGPKIAAYRNDLGFELMYVARWNEAESQLRKAIELDPALARAHVNLALTLSRMERFDEALASFRAVLPEADAHYNLGLMYRGQKRYAEAVASFKRVLDIQPKFSAAKLQLDQMTANPPVEQTTTRLAQADIIDPVKTGPAGIASQPLPTDATIAPQALPSVAAGAPTGTPARNVVPNYLSRLIDDLGGSENAPQSAMAQTKADITLSESYAKAPSTETTNAPSPAAMTQSAGAEPLTVAEWRIETPATEGNDDAEAESDATSRLFAADGIPSLPIQYGPTAGEDEAFDPTSDQIVAPPNSWTRWNGEVITFRALREILNNEANCIHDENLVDSDANAGHAIAEGEIEVLNAPAGDEATIARQPSGFATGRATITVEPSEQGADSLILRALASATGDSDWRTPFADMMQLAAVLRNEHLCWRNSQEAEAAQLAATTRVVPARNVINRPQPADSAVGPTVENTQQPSTGPPAFGSPIDPDDPRQE